MDYRRHIISFNERKGKTGSLFRQHVLDSISQMVEECVSDNDFVDEEDDNTGQSGGTRVFRPFIRANHENFDEMMRLDLSDIVWSRQMHARTHISICFNYGSKKCRARFPLKIVTESTFNTDTGIISIRRNHSWVNNYNKWIAIITHANHDCRTLFIKNHSLATIHYVMKYSIRPETALHSKAHNGCRGSKSIHGRLGCNDRHRKNDAPEGIQ